MNKKLTKEEEIQRTTGYLLGLQDANAILWDLTKKFPNDKQLGKEVRRIMHTKKNKKDGHKK